MSKELLIAELQLWLAEGEFTPDRGRFDELSSQYQSLMDATSKEQLDRYLENDGTEEDFEYRKDEEDIKFGELSDIYHERRKKIEKQRKEEAENNYKEKRSLIEELQGLIHDEENIAKAYKRFNAIKQKWNELGPVTADKRREVQAEYSRLIEQFYYNIQIYRELQQNDLKKNLELKLEIIANIKALESEKSISQVDFLLHKYLSEWDTLGPTFKDQWEKIRDDFKEAINGVYERLREHRKSVKDDHQANYLKKKALVEKAQQIAESENIEVKDWQRQTKELIELQKAWKHVGYAGKNKNDEVWKEFREFCDAYFAKRKEFIDKNSTEHSETKGKKKSLIEKAKEIHLGEDVEQVANQLKSLQREWKNTGKLLPQEEFKMFREFRKYCDLFFDRKKNEAEALQKQIIDNLHKKEELLMNFSKEVDQQLKEKGEALIEEWKSQWSQIGDVSDKMKEKVEKSFSSIISKAYKELGISSSVLAEKEFTNKLDMISAKADAEGAFAQERATIQRQIKEAETAVLLLEDKLSFFTYSKGDNPLKNDLLSKIEAAQKVVSDLREKRKKLDMTIKELKHQKQAASEVESTTPE